MIISSKRYIVIALFWLVSVCGVQAQSAQHAIETSQTLRFEAMVRKDTAYLKANLCPELVYIHSNGFKEDFQAHINSITSGKIRYAAFKPIETRTNVLKKHAICTGIVQVNGEYEGTPFQIALHYTAIYRKVKKKWLLERWQSTKVS